MKIEQLAYFVAINRCGSFSAAAEEMYISQSSISKAVIALERELGLELFKRNTRHVLISPAGEHLLPYFEHMVDEYQAMRQIKDAGIQQETIRIGGVPVLSLYGITSELLQFEDMYPNYHIELDEFRTDRILSGIDEKNLDVGIVRLQLPIPNGSRKYRITPLIDDKQVLVLTKGSIPTYKEALGLSQCRDIPFLQINTDPILAAYHIEQITASIPNAKIILMNSKIDTIVNYIVQRPSASVMMSRVAQANFVPGVEVRDFEEQTALTLCAITRAGTISPAAQKLVGFLLSRFKESSSHQ